MHANEALQNARQGIGFATQCLNGTSPQSACIGHVRSSARHLTCSTLPRRWVLDLAHPEPLMKHHLPFP